MAETSLDKPPLQKPRPDSRPRHRSTSLRRTQVHRPRRLDSAIYVSEHDPLVQTCNGVSWTDTRGRSPSRRRGSSQDLEWASQSSRGGESQGFLPGSLPVYDPKPLLHREDAFKVVDKAVEARKHGGAAPNISHRRSSLEDDNSTEYDSDELELCTTQFPDFEEEGMYDYLRYN